GLARAINEQLLPGTEVFIAEMGTYGKGEIAELCRWIPPDVAAMVAIGPVHLERFRTEERIVEAKSEILDRADTGVIAIDHPLLAALAEERSANLDVVTASTGADASVRVLAGKVYIDGRDVGEVAPEVFEINLGVAVAIGLALGGDADALAGRLDDLPRPEHRQSISKGEGGFVIIDDTYNSNPGGAIAALSKLQKEGKNGRKVVVTPGMVELGPRQREENASLSAQAASIADDLLIVGATNRAALLEGSAHGPASVTVVGSREEAVLWVRSHLGPGDAVLYENDLPDHYP
ncbi:MAG: glutamate ligase domain-containing protein, partial [Acidimicrobiia bacterium]